MGGAAAAASSPRGNRSRRQRGRARRCRRRPSSRIRRAISAPDAPPTTYFTDPDVLTIDPSFNALVQANTSIQRLWTGALWTEGPAWNSQGRYLVWSDIPNNRQMRWLEDDGRVSVFRSPSNNSNGNTFDPQGRQISCEHSPAASCATSTTARSRDRGGVPGQAAEFAERCRGASDGSIWFTDPPYGGQLYEGAPDASGGPTNPAGRLNPRAGQPAEIGTFKRELPTNVYRVDPGGRVDMVVTEDQVPDPNGLTFSPDFRGSTSRAPGKGPATPAPAARARSTSFDVGADNKVSNRKLFTRLHDRRRQVRPGRLALRRRRQLWVSSNAGRALGYSGVTVWNPAGQTPRPDPHSRSLRQPHLRRPEAQSPLHGGEPVDLRALCRDPGRRTGLNG